MLNQKNNITPGQLISLLEKRPQDQIVFFDFGYEKPLYIESYRGYYNEIAIGYECYPPSDDFNSINVSEFITMLRSANGKTYTGYKNGDFTMDLNTPLWASNFAVSSGTQIVGIYDFEDKTVLATEYNPFCEPKKNILR